MLALSEVYLHLLEVDSIDLAEDDDGTRRLRLMAIMEGVHRNQNFVIEKSKEWPIQKQKLKNYKRNLFDFS